MKFLGAVLLDLIIDPVTIGDCVGFIVCIDNGGSGSCTCAQASSSDDSYISSGLSTKSGNLGQGRINFTNASLIPSGALITDANLHIE